MISFQDFKKEYFNTNKDLLEKVKPGLRNEMIQDAYMKHYNRTRCKDYYDENKEHIRDRHKQYYEANKEDLTIKKKLYRESHKEELSIKKREYYEANKEDIKEKQKARREANKEQIDKKIECDCGCVILKRHLSRHMKTAKHTELLQKQSDLQSTNLIKY